MIIIKVENKISLEKALKKYKKKFDNLKISKELRDRKQFKKKSVKRREEIQKAEYIEKKYKTDE